MRLPAHADGRPAGQALKTGRGWYMEGSSTRPERATWLSSLVALNASAAKALATSARAGESHASGRCRDSRLLKKPRLSRRRPHVTSRERHHYMYSYVLSTSDT